jgi:hypothetical protein
VRERTSKGPLHPEPSLPLLTAEEIQLACRPSVERMLAAAVRKSLLEMRRAAPEYADTPES